MMKQGMALCVGVCLNKVSCQFHVRFILGYPGHLRKNTA